MKLKQIVLIVLFFNLRFLAVIKAQTSTVMPPSAQASSLVKNVDRPVSTYTGVPQLEIPIWDIKLRNLSIPVQLSYNAGGVKVEEEASNVGLSWSLSAGGVITRVVKDIPDDYNKDRLISHQEDRWGTATPSDEHPRLGRFWSGKYEALRDFDASNTSAPYVNEKFRDFKSVYNSAMLDGMNDLEPDVFYFSFGNKSGKFVFDVSGATQKIVMVPYQDILVSHTLNSLGEISSFTITDNDGTRYLFDQTERIERIAASIQYPTYTPPDQIPERSEKTVFTNFNSSWYLSEIQTVNQELVKLYYANEEMDQYDRPGSSGVKGNWISGAAYNIISADNSGRNKSSTKKRLLKIKTDKEVVNFVATHHRQDLEMNSYAINEIEVQDPLSNTIIKSFNLSYSYFQSPMGEALNGMTNVFVPLLGGDHPSYYKRLRLDAIQEKGQDIVLPPYSFTYDESGMLPNRFSYQQDVWGYFNGAANNQSLFPEIYVYPGLQGSDRFRVYADCNNPQPTEYYVMPGANRLPNSSTIKIGTIKQIVYPTGGRSEFEFEANTFTYDGCQQIGGGIRIKKIKQFDSSNAAVPASTTSYTYTEGESQQSSGRIISMPVFLVQTLAEFLYFNNSQMVLGTTNGSYVGYNRVSEIVEGGFNNGITIYEYSIPATYNQPTDSEYGLYNISQVKWYDDQFLANDPEYLQYKNAYHLLPNTVPFPPNPDYDWNRGKLIKQTILNAAGLKIKEVLNKYKIFDAPLWKGSRNVYGLSYGTIGNVVLYSKYEMLANRANVLENTSTTIYPTDGAQPVLESTKLTYSQTGHMNPIEKISHSSNGDIRTQKMIYPSDYPDATPLPLDLFQMKSKNMASYPIEKLTYLERNGQKKLIAGELVQHTIFDNLVVPQKFYRTEAILPLPDFVESSTIYETFHMDSRYREKVALDRHDAKGNILQLTSSLKTQSFIWDYQNNYLSASVENAGVDDIAYSGFEGDGNGNWIFNGAITNGTTPYGKRSLGFGVSGSISKANLNPAKTYEVIMNYKSYYGTAPGDGFMPVDGTDNAGWGLYKKIFSGQTNFVYSNIDCAIDEIRICPIDAQMTTYTYQPLVGMTSKTDPKGMTTYYEYDAFQRLKNIKDQAGNIIKNFCYNYAGQQTGCPIAAQIGNQALSQNFIKVCPSGQVGSTVAYTVPADTYFAGTLAAANALAQQDINSNGQNYANMNGSCIGVSSVLLSYYNYSASGSISSLNVSDGNGTTVYSFTNADLQAGVNIAPGTYTFRITVSRIGWTEMDLSLSDGQYFEAVGNGRTVSVTFSNVNCSNTESISLALFSTQSE